LSQVDESIAIVGYGYVGKAVHHGFSNMKVFISDPKYTNLSVIEICQKKPLAIFICVPTPTSEDGQQYTSIFREVMSDISRADYRGIIVIKSTLLPQELIEINDLIEVIYNPEFLSHKTANEDFINPEMLVLAGHRSEELLEIYRKYSIVRLDKVFITDLKTASFVKYAMNTFYATKIIFMNQLNEIVNASDGDWEELTNILKEHSWMGREHYKVPGTDGKYGFGGQCFPKDAKAFLQMSKVLSKDFTLLEETLKINEKIRG